ncbi:MAG: hypothetical protein ACRD1E_12440, partial [Terriglobales bacterium]
MLTVNSGSSSLKLAVFDGEVEAWRQEQGGLGDAAAFAAALARMLPRPAPAAVAHRVVAPLNWSTPKRVDATLLAELRGMVPLAPDHLPQALAAIAAAARAYSGVPQVACSDSAFHQTMPAVARAVAVPAAGLRRFGYHGLS